MTTVEIRYVDHGVGEYGLFGKDVARSNVRGMTEAEIDAEIAAMLAIVGQHCMAVRVEEVAR